jgi:hypothetical protein
MVLTAFQPFILTIKDERLTMFKQVRVGVEIETTYLVKRNRRDLAYCHKLFAQDA